MTDVLWLLLLLVLVGLFVLYELFGVDRRFKHLHTISYLAQRHRWLAILIGALFVVGGLVGLGWWLHHMGSVILK